MAALQDIEVFGALRALDQQLVAVLERQTGLIFGMTGGGAFTGHTNLRPAVRASVASALNLSVVSQLARYSGSSAIRLAWVISPIRVSPIFSVPQRAQRFQPSRLSRIFRPHLQRDICAIPK
ncbi:hypothetical protein KQX64_06920 [Rhodopseudomonas palustris]|nr:hypothetical protein KQX64_06920 [Rhodopseudomonas palustris]